MLAFAVSCKRILLGATLLALFATSAVGAIATDAVVSADKSNASTNVTTAAFSTASGNELLLAFVSADANAAGVNVSSVTSAGLTWQLVRRANAQMGTAEIWRAYSVAALSNVTVRANLSQSVAASITVVTFTGTDPATPIGNSAAASAASGAPSASLTTSRAGSWVFGVGTDWDRPVARTVSSSQTMVHQFMPTVGDTYWVQRQNAPTPASGTQVFISDTAPTNDRYNLSIVEVLPALTGGGGTHAVSGAITPAASGAGATVTISQSGTVLMTVIADGSGLYAASGLPDGAYTLTPSKTGFTFTPASMAVAVNGTDVTANFAAAAQAFTISGTVNPAAIGNGATVQLSGAASATTTANASGNFSFTGLANGSYTVTPSKSGVTFNPASLPATVNNANVSGIAFTANTWSISGTISPNGSGASVSLSGAANATVTANAAGVFTFSGLISGAYTITPSKAGFTITPASQPATINNGNVTGIAFSAAALPTFGISGTISPANIGSGTLVTLAGTTGASTTANSSGNYSFTGLPAGSFTVTPGKSGAIFTPGSAAVTISSVSATNVNFTGALDPNAVNLPDLSVIVPTGTEIHVEGTGANRVFFYTHDTYNGGSGPLEIQPIYNQASGNYQGYQNVYRFVSPGNWPLVRSTPVAGAFVFHAEHGHFHFPFASFGLYARNADGSIGAAVALSAKIGFCIANSFIYNSSLPNAGYGTWGSCSDPTSLRGLSIGAVDEYDYRDDGQSIPIPDLPNGTYWLRAFADPEGLLEESNETNNETDVELTITNGNVVTILRTVVPVLPAAPQVSVTSPTNLTPVSGVIQLAAATPSSGVASVRFLLDGLPFGTPVSSPPYTQALDTTTLQNGDHWLSAQATTAVGITGTSAVVFVTVNNSSTSPPTVHITDPDDDAVVSSVTGVGAVAVAQVGIPTVQFYVDGQPIGSPVAAPPFMTQWNTNTVSGGPHTLTAKATDQFGLFTFSAPVAVTVDNSSPPGVIGIDTTVFRDTQDTMQTPAFSTTGASDLLVAFVAYDGPLGTPQTATVTGAGLTWQLVKRSNAQAGTSEIWFAKATGLLTNVTVTSQPTRTGFHGSLTVVAFKNASGPGVAGQASAATGAPDIYVPGVAAGNWVFAVGNDWDRAVARTPVSGQVLVHQRIDTAVGDTFWVQSTAAPSTGTGLVTIHDNAPTNDQWNYAAVEIVADRQ